MTSLRGVLLAQDKAPTRIQLAMDAIRERVAVAPRGRLPSIRRLSDQLRISRSTVVDAYDRLVAEGTVEARRGSGFFATHARRQFKTQDAGPLLDRPIDPLWIMRQALASHGALQPGSGWLPDDWLAGDMLRRALRGIARDPRANVTAYGSLRGFLPLREYLAHRLHARSIPAEPDNIFLADSATRAIDIVCRSLIQPGDTVLVVDPCYFNFPYVLRAQGAHIVGVPYTPSGPDVERFSAACIAHRPKVYLTTAILHNPTGATIGVNAAHRLLRLAEMHDFVIVEDNIYADLAGHASTSCAALDGLERVIVIGSFSKTLTAAARCGFIVARRDWLDGLTDLALATSFGTNDLAAQATHNLLTDGSYRGHLDTLRPRLARAMAFTAQNLERLGLTMWTRPESGTFLWARLPDQLDSAQVAMCALAQGLVLAPGNVFSVTHTAGEYLRFNVSQCTDKRVFDLLEQTLRVVKR